MRSLFTAKRSRFGPLFAPYADQRRRDSIVANQFTYDCSLFVAALADYFYYETLHIRDESYVGMLGITGGIIKIFQIVNHGSGVILLLYTRGILLKSILNSKSENNDIILE